MLNGYNCVSSIQKVVDEINNELYGDRGCKPEFIVSEDIGGTIYLTIRYLGFAHTSKIFPYGDYGSANINSAMQKLFDSI